MTIRSKSFKTYALALVREAGVTRPAPPRTAVRGPKDVYDFMAPFAAQQTAEVFWILMLDSQHKIMCRGPVAITRGLLDCSLVHPREVFRPAILMGAAAIVLCHNHPSGDPTPSPDDRLTTEQLVEAGRIIQIPVQDHIVIGEHRYLSFAEAGLL